MWEPGEEERLAFWVETLTRQSHHLATARIRSTTTEPRIHSGSGQNYRLGKNSSDHENKSNRLVAAVASAPNNPGASFQERKDARSVRGNGKLR